MSPRRPTPPPYGLDLNMTPVIDIVFNLVIFFMVANNMSQQNLEYLVLPPAEMAAEDKGEDSGRLIINVVDLDAPEYRPRLEKGWVRREKPPIFVDGRQVDSLEDLRKWLRLRAGPLPKSERGRLREPREIPGTEWLASDRSVLVRCDQGQIFGWVQAIMEACSIRPDRPLAQELRESPMIYKLEIGVAEVESRR